jgi:uncharacterized membrane protein
MDNELLVRYFVGLQVVAMLGGIFLQIVLHCHHLYSLNGDIITHIFLNEFGDYQVWGIYATEIAFFLPWIYVYVPDL